MYKSVSPDLSAQLYSLCQTGGLTLDSSAQIMMPTQGRIHDVYLVQIDKAPFILQCLNPEVIKDTSKLENLINSVLAPASITQQLLPWPAIGNCMLIAGTRAWIRRHYIQGWAMTTRLSLQNFKAMANTLRQFHQSVTVAAFNRAGFVGVDPWSGKAGEALDCRFSQDTIITAAERGIVDRWVGYRQRFFKKNNRQHSTQCVVHRDPKPSNFIQTPDGSLVLIDFDTTGTGDPALDLGELLRAWLSSDELEDEANEQSDETNLFDEKPIELETGTDAQNPVPDSTQDSVADSSHKHIHDIQFLTVSATGFAQAVKALQRGYDDPTMTTLRIEQAAARCCLWQCERFLEDHFAGDLYYPVQARGDNILRAKAQLDALQLLCEMNG